ncbi:MAG: RNA chaperone Hfq [Deltaproteobacteria bacterium]|nr:RNA chaperone Hfq [Deltaproteobacteria bacterium]MCL5792796.1 RNA chaperone Hfq [Deltaproteobacteria bacterium]
MVLKNKMGEFIKQQNNTLIKSSLDNDSHKSQAVNIQDQFLNQLRKEKTKVSIELVSGTVVEGEIQSFDNYSIILENSDRYLIYKHGIILVKRTTV